MEEGAGFVEPIDREIIIQGDVGRRKVREYHEIAESLEQEIE